MKTVKEKSNDYNNYIEKHPNFSGCVIDANSDKAYFKNGKCHREDGPAVESVNVGKWYYKNGLKHRENGPAVEFPDGSKAYFKNGLKHREDGPAFERVDGYKSYWLNNKGYSYEDWKHEIMKLKLSRVLKKI